MHTDNNIASLYNITFRPAAAKTAADSATTVNGAAFENFYGAALDALGRTNAYLSAASEAQQDLAAGKTDDILSVIMAQEKAYSSLNFTVQVTNKVIEAYREIMRMQL